MNDNDDAAPAKILYSQILVYKLYSHHHHNPCNRHRLRTKENQGKRGKEKNGEWQTDT